MTALRRILAALVVPLLATACGGSGYGSTGPTTTGTPSTPGANEVIATSSLTFNPTTLSVAKGTTVSFTFQGVQHTVAFAAVTGAPAGIGATSNATVQRVFATAGTFGFQCTIHPSMTGTIVVN